MFRALGKIFTAILSVIFINSAFAIDSEYKNSLNKIEFTKISGDYYTINLYTQENYNEPLRVIKKSDLNYYILLPETKNAAPRANINTNDIRNVSAVVYPYAGQDVNNGYTKITINTTRPFTFDVNIKKFPQIKTQSKSDAIASNTPPKEALKEQVQKKNSKINQNSTIKREIPKISQETLNENKTRLKAQKPYKPEKYSADDTSNIAVAKAAKIEDLVREDVEKEKLNRKIEQEKKQSQEYGDIVFDNSGELEHVTLGENAFEPNLSEKIALGFSELKIKISQGEFGVLGIIISICAVFVALIMLFAIFGKKSKFSETKIRPKSELVDLKTKSTFEERRNQKTQSAKKQTKQASPPPKPQAPKPKTKGEYFQFEGNIQQTGLCSPTSSNASRKKYELHNYDPDLHRDYARDKIAPYRDKYSNGRVNQAEHEYDIIRRIIKEETFSNVKPKEFEFVAGQLRNENSKKISDKNPPDKYYSNNNRKQTLKTTATVQEEKVSAEPVVLSSVEIAPERGFMCISYNNNINLMGYLFDDVFALYNFKQSKLENYDIKYRLSEKTDDKASFIVKVENTKMLIKVTKNTMQLEVVM